MLNGRTVHGGPIRLAMMLLGLLAMTAACSEDPEPQARPTTLGSEESSGDSDSTSDTAETETTTESDQGADEVDDPTSYPSQIRIDQFGYRPGDPKVAVIADPEVGYDDRIEVEPGPAIQVRRVDDDEVVLAGTPEPWADGVVHEQSGDRGWWFDFTKLDEPGTYYLIDPEQGLRSGPFDIGDNVYQAPLEAALRMFWYNRGNTPHPPELGGAWSDDAAYVGPGQDTEARSVDAQDDDTTARDLSGGWFDAGDPNKYVTFASEPVHTLLSSYQRFPDVFDDDLGIPESGNGIPDVIDEVLWELDWLEKMQLGDGSLLIKMGVLTFASDRLPSKADAPRYYEEACSSSTITGAAMFAHGAVVLGHLPELSDRAAELQDRAESAWDRYQTMAKRDDCDPQVVLAGDADLGLDIQNQYEFVAAVYLFALTGESRYQSVVVDRHSSTLAFEGDGFGNYLPEQADALQFYQGLPDADPAVVQSIQTRIDDVIGWSQLFGFDPNADLYRAHIPDEMYHWGSNRGKANAGADNLLLDGVDAGPERALAHLNYFHGVNPLGLVYLSNMDDLGAEHSAQFLFHYWFGDLSAYDVNEFPEPGPAPGYVVGGPNRDYSGTDAPPAAQPVQKSYRDWAAYSYEPSWEITEPSITYQAGYIRLITAVLGS